jgi:hypothetical protein
LPGEAIGGRGLFGNALAGVIVPAIIMVPMVNAMASLNAFFMEHSFKRYPASAVDFSGLRPPTLGQKRTSTGPNAKFRESCRHPAELTSLGYAACSPCLLFGMASYGSAHIRGGYAEVPPKCAVEV